MHSIKPLSRRFGELHHAYGHWLKTGFVIAGDNVADCVFLYCIRLDDG
jgi:hypothetical protein